MDYKQKYEGLMRNIEHLYESVNPEWKRTIECYIPELKETEDERIRRELIRAFTVTADKRDYEIYGNGITYGQVLAWLEKQGLLNNDKYQTVPVEILDRLYESEKELERLKQKPFDYENANIKQKAFAQKIESKFKIGDWIVQEGVGTYKVVEVCKWYEVIGIDGNQYSISFLQENGCHLWTIRDARDGDMLTTHMSPAGDWIGIYKQSTDDMFKTHCFLSAVGEFVINPNRCRNHGTHGLYPATKEQRDLLFKKMKEAGYEWDAEEKKMRKIGQKASIDFSDLKTWKYIVDAILTKEHGIGQYLDNGRTEIMAKELQERFGNIMQIPAWSEEDETKIKSIIALLKSPALCTMDGNKGIIDEIIKYLKSLKERMKGE